MICSRCHRYGIYWKNLGGLNEHTYCPWCGGINCHKTEQEDEENDDDEINEAESTDDWRMTDKH